MDGWFSFIYRCGEVCRTYNRHVERSRAAKPSVVDMSGKYGTKYVETESVGVWIVKQGSILAKVKDLSVISERLKNMSSEGFDDVGLLHRVDRVFIFSYRNRTYRIIRLTEFAYWSALLLIDGVNSESNPLERKDAEGSSLMKLESEEHWMSIVVIQIPLRMLTMIRCRLIVGFGERRKFRLHGKELEDDAGEFWRSSQGDCGNVTMMDNEDVTQLLFLKKTPSLRLLLNPRIWVIYGNVKEDILLHNALSRQTKDAGIQNRERSSSRRSPIPFLFLLVIEALQIVIVEACKKDIYKGISLTDGGDNLSLLQYVDDALFFGNWSRLNANTLIHIINCFEEASGLKVNLAKSRIFRVGVDIDEVETVASSLGCIHDSIPFLYWPPSRMRIPLLALLSDSKFPWARTLFFGRILGPLKDRYPRLFALENHPDCLISDRWGLVNET
ncbi:hypothetical protein Tco_0143759 [Tanacetum coccineum]